MLATSKRISFLFYEVFVVTRTQLWKRLYVKILADDISMRSAAGGRLGAENG